VPLRFASRVRPRDKRAQAYRTVEHLRGCSIATTGNWPGCWRSPWSGWASSSSGRGPALPRSKPRSSRGRGRRGPGAHRDRLPQRGSAQPGSLHAGRDLARQRCDRRRRRPDRGSDPNCLPNLAAHLKDAKQIAVPFSGHCAKAKRGRSTSIPRRASNCSSCLAWMRCSPTRSSSTARNWRIHRTDRAQSGMGLDASTYKQLVKSLMVP